jgi:hypothetical protein
MPLLSMLARTWNQMAEEQELKTEWARKVFRMDDDQMSDETDREWMELMDQGVDSKVASAFVDLKPHLLEKEAILRFRRDHPELMLDMAMPEINEPEEALYVADGDHRLDEPGQKEALLEMFKELVRNRR